ncbi:hypothetical protein [Demequina aestuarii]|uniref:hypothetical protein n=1 Tax=Demequina aestuarii TaxID=327095 RepID=UPI000782F771|nr:hypothetical protein [Demequina aestuarii]
MTAVDTLPGDPVALRSEVTTLEADVAAIDEAIALLYDTNVQLTGRAADELYARSLDAAVQIESARDRYEGTAVALRTYVVEMEAAHREADAALDEAPAALAERDSAQEAVTRLSQLVAGAASDGAPTAAVDAYEEQLYTARRRLDRAEGALAEVEGRWRTARDRQQAAAAVAVAQIRDATEGTDTSLLDDIGAFFSWVGQGLADFGRWLGDALAAIGEFLAQYAGLLIVFLAVLAAVALAAIVFPVIALVGIFTVAVIAFAAIAGTLLLVSSITDSSGMHRGDDYPLEMRSPNPDQDTLPPVGPSYAALLEDLAWVDAATARRPVYDADGRFIDWERRDEAATMIKVVALRDEDTGAIVGWRVQIPSTQEWGMTGSALNDLPTNVLHALAPGQDTAMEQAVWDAMERAGALDSDAPVMLAGWSQGGMTSGEIAIDPRLADREVSVVAGGSPMDQYRNELTGQGARTTVFTHPDLVSGLEGVRLTPADVLAPHPEFVQHFEGTLAHDAMSYSQQAARLQPELRPGDEVFFADFGEGVAEEVHVFEYTRTDPAPAMAPHPTPSPGPAPTPPVDAGGR